MTVNESIGHRLREVRKKNKLTQGDVAAIIGVSRNHYSKYERGENIIPFDKAIILTKHYNCSLDWLAGLSENPEKQRHTMNRQPVAGYLLDKEFIRDLVETLNKILQSDK